MWCPERSGAAIEMAGIGVGSEIGMTIIARMEKWQESLECEPA